MVKNRYIILLFLFLAWTIIFVHSIVPHHHSENHLSEDHHTECNHDHSHHLKFDESAGFHDCDHDCNDHACHFHVDVLTQVSIDNIFITNSENTFFNYLSFQKNNNCSYYIEFISTQFLTTNHLRGPPSIS